MPEIVHGSVERYQIQDTAVPQTRELLLGEAIALLLSGAHVSLFVDGWETPWPCRLDEAGLMLARCPGAQAEPAVVQR